MYQVLSLFKSFLFWGSRILENKLWFTTCISPLNLRVSCPVCTFISALFMLSGPNTVDCLNKFQLKVHLLLIICIHSQSFKLCFPQGLTNGPGSIFGGIDSGLTSENRDPNPGRGLTSEKDKDAELPD